MRVWGGEPELAFSKSVLGKDGFKFIKVPIGKNHIMLIVYKQVA